MKKALQIIICILTFAFMASYAVNAVSAQVVGEIRVLDGNGQTVATYEVVTNDPTTSTEDVIQKAFSYCRDNASENNIHTVIVPKGEYAVDSSINIFSYTVVDFSGSVITRIGECGSILRFGKGTDIVYGYDGYKRITIKNAVLDAENRGTSSLVRFAHATGVEIDSVEFRNTTDVMHLLTFAACENVIIRNCQFRDMKTTKRLDGLNCEALQIDVLKDGYFNYPAQDGTPTKNITVTGCTFENVLRGIGTHTAIAGHYFDGMVIKGNTFKNIESYAVRALNYINSDISENTIIDCGSGITCGTVTNEALVNFYAPLNGAQIRQDINVSIRNNTVSLKSNGADKVAFGIRLVGAKVNNYKDRDGKTFSADCRISGVRVENNTVTGSVTETNYYALYIVGAVGSEYGKNSNVSIKNNRINFGYNGETSNTVYGIRAENSEKVYFYANTVTDNATNVNSCVTVDGSADIYLEKNTLSGAKSFGIRLQNTKGASVVSNTVSNIGSNGIYVLSGCTDVNIKSNKLKAFSGYGIAISDGKVNSISSNKIYSAKKYSIYLTGKAKAETVSSNYICGGKNTGIYLNKKASATTITKNTIDVVSKKADGITVNDKATVTNITNNKINGKAKKESKKLKVKCKYGIRINSASCKVKKITGNAVNQCNDTGIYIAKAKTKSTVSKNTVNKAKYGIIYKSSKAKLSKNTFKSCSKAKTKTL